jgi:hypothetical protein
MPLISLMQPHRVLLIPELLQNILSFLDRADTVANACVCKQWSEIALDLIWREVNSLPRLLALLRPHQTCGFSVVRIHFSKCSPQLDMCDVGLRWTARLKGLGEISEVCQSCAYLAIPAEQNKLFHDAGRYGQGEDDA